MNNLTKVDFKNYKSLISVDYAIDLYKRSIQLLKLIFKKLSWFNVLLILVFFVLFYVLNFFFSWLQSLNYIEQSSFLIKDTINFIKYLFSIFLLLLFVSYRHLAVLNLINENKLTYKGIYKKIKENLKKYIAFLLAVFVLQTVAFLFLVIPGVVLGIMLLFSPLLLINNNLGVNKAIKNSIKLVEYFWWEMFAYFNIFLLIVLALNTINFYYLSTGMIITKSIIIFFLTPFVFTTLTVLYNDLKYIISSEKVYNLQVSILQKIFFLYLLL